MKISVFWGQQVLLKSRYTSTRPHSVIFYRRFIFNERVRFCNLGVDEKIILKHICLRTTLFSTFCNAAMSCIVSSMSISSLRTFLYHVVLISLVIPDSLLSAPSIGRLQEQMGRRTLHMMVFRLYITAPTNNISNLSHIDTN